MRVIAGKYRRQALIAPEGYLTRPTYDRVKEAVFSIIQNKINNATVLDLFAGSGGLGIEALSRGANFCYFNDCNFSAIKCINHNLTNLKINNLQYEVSNLDFSLALEKCRAKKMQFDLIFLDPPYKFTTHQQIIDYILYNQLLKMNGKIIIEQEYALSTKIQGNIKEYKYGSTLVTILTAD